MAEEKKGERKPDEARKPAQGDGGGKHEKPRKSAAPSAMPSPTTRGIPDGTPARRLSTPSRAP